MYKRSGKYYFMIKPVGSWTRKGCEHYALWQPVKMFLWIIPIACGEQFWLDMYGFEEI